MGQYRAFINLLSLSLVVIPGLLNLCFAQVKFYEGRLEAAFGQAAFKNKPVLFYGYFPESPACYQFEKNILNNKRVSNFINSKFTSFALNLYQASLDSFRLRYRLQSVPVIIIFSKNGQAVHKCVGTEDPNVLLDCLKNSLTPTKQLYTLITAINNGDSSQTTLYNYLYALTDAGEPLENESRTFVERLTPQDWLNPLYWPIVKYVCVDDQLPCHRYLVKHLDSLVKSQNDWEVDDFLMSCVEHNTQAALRSKDSLRFFNILKLINYHKASTPTHKLSIKLIYTLEYYKYFNLEKKYIQTASYLIDTLYYQHPPTVQAIAFQYYGMTSDTGALRQALRWVRPMPDTVYSTVLTKAALLYKLDLLEEAEEKLQLGFELGLKKNMALSFAIDLQNDLENKKKRKLREK